MANSGYRFNHIQTLHQQGEILISHVDISYTFNSFFSQIFGVPHHPILHANWDIHYPNRVWSSRDIEHPFDEEEIREAVFGFDAEKSLGPDGFPILFFQKFWDFVKPDKQFYNRNVDI